MGRHSSGCRTCVRRRVRCDETKSSCLRCNRYGQRCPGYPKTGAAVFVDETVETHRKYRPRISDQTSKWDNALVFEQHRCLQPQAQPDLAAFAPTIFQAFLLSRFVSTGAQYFDYNTNREWMKIPFLEPHKYPLASHTLLVLAECFYGRQHHQGQIVVSSMQGYGHVLRRLRQSLTDQTLRLSYDVLAAITSLYFFECFTFTSNEAWLQHAEALSNLIEALGWTFFRNAPASHVLESVRASLICAAIVKRKRTFLESETWKMYACQDDILAYHTAELSHIYAKLPCITQQILSLQSKSRDRMVEGDAVNELQDQIGRLRKYLDSWSTTWMGSNYAYVRNVPLSSFSFINIEFDRVFSNVLSFKNLKVAKVFVDYWTTRILVFLQARKLTRMMHQRMENCNTVDLDPEASTLAINICRSIPFFVQSEHIESAPWYLAVSIRVAYLALPSSSVEAQWLHTTRNKLATLSGFEMLRNILHNVPMVRAS